MLRVDKLLRASNGVTARVIMVKLNGQWEVVDHDST